ncbi:MAG: MbnP family protein, partial [Bacteroidota bacterium]
MKKLFPVLLLLATVTFLACPAESDDPATLQINFKTTYDGAPLVMLDQEYTYPDGNPLKVQVFNYYISNLGLTKGLGIVEALSEVDLLDFSEIYTQADAERGIVRLYEEVPSGTYDGLTFGLGVAEDLNATTPSDYEGGHPLSSNHWTGLSSYVFAKIE